MCRCIFQMFFFLISMQQTHVFCCLEESQQKWRNTCVSSVPFPYEYDSHSTLFQLPFCLATENTSQSPSWTCLSQQTQGGTSGWRRSLSRRGSRTLRRGEGKGWAGWLHQLFVAVQVHWGCRAGWALAGLRREAELPAPGWKAFVPDQQMIWCSARLWPYLRSGHGIQENEAACHPPAPAVCWLPRVSALNSHTELYRQILRMLGE